MENEVKEIMLERLKDMNEMCLLLSCSTDYENYPNKIEAYTDLCKAMNEISKTLAEISAREEFVRRMTEDESED